MRRMAVCLFSTVLVLVFTFIGSTQPVAAAETLKIGALASFSGGLGRIGITCLRGWELMAEKINAAGGIKVGDKKYQIELLRADDKSNMDVGLTLANKLVFNDKIKYIVGPFVSGTTLAILPITEANKVMVMSVSFSPKVLGADKLYSFRLFASGLERTEAIFTYLAKNRPDVKTIALIGFNDETGWGTSKYAKEKGKAYGIETVFEDFFQRGTTDFFPILTKMVAKNPGVLIIHGTPTGDTALLLQQSHQLGYKGLKMSPSHMDPKMLVDRAGVEAVEGFAFQAPDPESPTLPQGMKELYKTYYEKYKEEADPVVFSTYAYLWVLKMAIEKAGTLDTTAVAKTMATLEGEFPYGHFSMGGLKTYGANHQIVEPIFISEMRKGKLFGLGGVIVPIP